MKSTGIILAVLDCDFDAVEDFNRWYDLEHVPPNVSLAGVVLGRRYVATPELHAIRVAGPASPLADRRGTFVTMYTLCDPPAVAIAAMSVLRDELYANGRMRFPAEKKTVRDGGAYALVSAVSSPALGLPPIDVPFVAHTGILVTTRTGDATVSAWYRDDWAPRAATLDGVHGVLTFASADGSGRELDLVLFEGDAVEQTRAIRASAPHHVDATVIADAPFLTIDPLHYPWVEALRASDLPPTVA